MLVSDLFLAIKKLGSLKSQLTVSAASGVSETDRVSVPAIDSPATARPLSSGSIVAGSGRAGEPPWDQRTNGQKECGHGVETDHDSTQSSAESLPLRCR